MPTTVLVCVVLCMYVPPAPLLFPSFFREKKEWTEGRREFHIPRIVGEKDQVWQFSAGSLFTHTI